MTHLPPVLEDPKQWTQIILSYLEMVLYSTRLACRTGINHLGVHERVFTEYENRYLW